MRLSRSHEIAIVKIVSDLDAFASVYLYGSRTLDSEKGGDIDLLIICLAVVGLVWSGARIWMEN